MARRGRGEGSISKRADGRWQAAISVGRGKREFIYGKTQGEVRRALTAALRRRDQGLPIATSSQPLGAYLQDWLASVRPNIRPKTQTSYEGFVRLHIAPTLGKVPLDKLTAQQIESLLAAKRAAGSSPQSLIHIRSILRQALGRAVKHDLIFRNPAEMVDPPRLVRVREQRAFEPDEARRFLEAAKGDRLEPLWVLAITSGLRQGELLGLQWRDLDLDAGTVNVQRQLQRVRGEVVLVELKTGRRSRRQNAIPQAAVDVLRAHRERELAAGRVALPMGYVFTTGTGTPLEPRNVLRSFKALLHAAKLPDMPFHGLRHSAASSWLAMGVPMRVVQEMLGHQTMRLTADLYAHVFEKAKRDAADAMDRMLGAPNLTAIPDSRSEAAMSSMSPMPSSGGAVALSSNGGDS